MSDIHLWDAMHSYYCTEGQYFSASSDTISEFKSWAEFLDEMGDADMDYNMLFRWDWTEESEDDEPTFSGDVYYRNGKLKLFFMAQRKGFHQCSIVEVCRADEAAVIAYLKPRLAHLMSLWAPLSHEAEFIALADRRLAELDFLDAPTDAQRAERAELFALLQRARGEA